MEFIPYGRQSIAKSDIKAVADALAAEFITRGPKSGEFEAALCAYTGARYAVAVSSGTAALHIACIAAGIKPGSGVLVPALSFVASANCVLYCGGSPVFCDILRERGTMDPADMLKKASAARCSAVIPVNLAGRVCELSEIRRIAQKYRLLVIEDNAQAFGAEYRSTPASSCRYTDMSVLSFHPLKTITTGEGGAVLTNNKALYKKLTALRSHGIIREKNLLKFSGAGPWHYEMQMLGYNYRITDFQCALGLNQLKRINGLVEERREKAALYSELLEGSEGLKLSPPETDGKMAWAAYPVFVKGGAEARERIFNMLRRSGIEAQVNFMPIYRHPYYRRQAEFRGVRCAQAEAYYSEVIYLPVFPGLRKRQIRYICSLLRKACGPAGGFRSLRTRKRGGVE